MQNALRRETAKQGGLQNERGLMKYVYLLESLSALGKRYVGITSDLTKRLKEHNDGKSPHTKKHVPWKIVVSICFADATKAEAFERYLKHGSGHAFTNRHFW